MKKLHLFMIVAVLCVGTIVAGITAHIVRGSASDDCQVYDSAAITNDDDTIYIPAFCWLNVITPGCFEIVEAYLAVAFDEDFDDWMVNSYILDIMGIPALRYYDSIPFESMSDNPRRILVRMMEGYIIDFMMVSYEFHGYHRNRRSGYFGRNMID